MAIEYGILSEPSSLTTSTKKWEMGWAFTIGDQDVRVVGLRVKFPATQTVVAKLWSSDKSKLASCDITVSSTATWTEGYFSEPIMLNAGKQYVISCYNNSTRYYAATSAFTFSEYFASVEGGRYVSGSGNFPANSEPNSIYPLIDIIISPIRDRVPFGTAEFSTDVIRKVSSVKTSYIDWDADIPEGTSVKIYSRLSNGEYELCERKGSIAGLGSGTNLADETLHLKVEMTTEDLSITPVLTRIRIQIFDRDDVNCIFLTFDPDNTKSIQRAAGDITVAYDGSGSLIGEGGPVLAFEHTFTPEGLDPKNNPNDAEHIEIADIVATGGLLQIYYTDVANGGEHITLSNISAVGSLTRIEDI